MPVDHGGERRDGFDRQVHVAGDDDDGQADRHDAENVDCSMMLAKMPSWK